MAQLRNDLGPSAFNPAREVAHRIRMAKDIENGCLYVIKQIGEVRPQLWNVQVAFQAPGQTDILRANILAKLNEARDKMVELLVDCGQLQEKMTEIKMDAWALEHAHSRPLPVPPLAKTTIRLKDMQP